MTPLAAKVIWLVGVVGWFIIRYPHDRRARRTPKLRRADRGREIALMAISAAGLGVLPFIYVVRDAPHFASYPFRPWQAWLGAAVFAASLWLFHRTHKDLGRNWSVTLEVRDGGSDRLRNVVLSARRARGGADDRNVRRRVPPLHGADRAHLAGDILAVSRRCVAMHARDRGPDAAVSSSVRCRGQLRRGRVGSDACVRREPRPSPLWGRG